MNQKQFILLIMVVAVLIGGGAYFAWIKNVTPPIPPPTPDLTPTSTPNPIPTSTPTQTHTLNNVPVFDKSFYELTQGQILKDNDIVFVEGVLGSSASRSGEKYIDIADLPYNAICFSDPINAEEGSIIKAKVNIIKAEEGKCSDSKLLEFSIVYSREEIKNILAKFLNFCSLIEEDVNSRKLTAFAVKGDCNFDYRWVPSQSLLLVNHKFYGSDNTNASCSGTSHVNADLLISPAQNQLKAIYLFPQDGRICK